MGGKSSSKSSQQTSSSQISQVNDGDFAGASDFVIDESDNRIEDSYNTTNEMTIEDSYNQNYHYTDESDNSFHYTDESDHSMSVDDSFNTTNNYEDNSDHSQTFIDESDNSQYFEDNRDLSQTFVDESVTDNSQHFEDNSDRSVDNSQYFEDNSDRSQTFIDESDHSQYFEDNRDLSQTFVDESDNSIENTGEFAGVNGNISILDGGVIEEAFSFANNVNAEGNATAREAVNAITDTAINTTNIAANAITDNANESILSTERTASNSLSAMFASLQESLGFGRDSISALQEQSDSYAQALSANVDEFNETLEEVTRNAISNAGSQVTASNQANTLQLETIAALAESTATGGATSFADSSANQVKYLALAVAAGLAAIAFK